MIDVIIPTYNSQDNLVRCLSSISMQTIRNELKVTLVNDGGASNKYFVELFSNMLNIQEIGYEENRGPGYARRFGFLNTSGDYIINLDSDDTFYSAFSLQLLKKGMVHSVICGSPFLQECKDLKFKNVSNKNMVWLHGIMYDRSFLKKNNILMNESRANEDVGFNLLCNLCIKGEKVNYIDIPTYCWHSNPNSIVRKDVKNYSDNLSFDGYVENIIWAFNEAHLRSINTEFCKLEKLRMLLNLHILYKQSVGSSPKYADKNFKLCKKYYKEIFKPVENNITQEQFFQVYNKYTKDDITTYLSMKSINEFIENLNK